jgi:DNA-binding IscR family transcriptional regulator
LLVRAGPAGLPAGQIAAELDLPNTTLSFHLNQLRHAGLVRFRRTGRSLIYAAEYQSMNDLLAYLMENCCQGNAECGVESCNPVQALQPEGVPKHEASARARGR